ncbi:MAG: hypothetical protein D6683_16255, partial [Actinomyces sp.]
MFASGVLERPGPAGGAACVADAAGEPDPATRLAEAAGVVADVDVTGWGRRRLVELLGAVAALEAACAAVRVKATAAIDTLGDAGADGVSSWKTISGCSEREARR